MRHPRPLVHHPLPHRICHPLDHKSRPPLNPGATPVIPAGATGPKAASIRYTNNAATLAFNTFANVDRTLRQQLHGTFNDTFLLFFHKPHRRYSGSSTLDLLTHLYATYAVISNADWLQNNKRFREPYLPSVPINVAWRKISDTVAYADAVSEPYSNKKVTDNAYQLVLNTGIFAADFQEWNQRTADNKTLPHLKTFSRPRTGSGTSCCKTRPEPPTAPLTTPPQAHTTGTYSKRR